MPVAVAANLLAGDPPAVQVVLTGMAIGDSYDVTGSALGGTWTWPVRAGRGVATSTQVVLGDNAAPINTPVTYIVTTGASGTATSTPITVLYDDGAEAKYVLQTMDGRAGASFRWLDNGVPRSYALPVALFQVPGRSYPLAIHGRARAESGELVVATTAAQTLALEALITTGGPLILRTDGAVRDLPAVMFIVPVSASNVLTGADYGNGTVRRWQMAYQRITDPEPDKLAALPTWDDFDTVYASLTGADFDSEWAGATGDQFDREDWRARL